MSSTAILDQEGIANDGVCDALGALKNFQISQFESIQIGNSGLTVKWLNNLPGNVLDKKNLISVIVQNTESDGFVSQIVLVELKYIGGASKHMVVKLPDDTLIKKAIAIFYRTELAEGIDDQFIRGLPVSYNREIDFYEMKPIPGLKIPIYYGSQRFVYQKQVGAIVMENLRTMTAVPFHVSFNMNQVAAVGDQLLTLQKFSIGMSDEWNKNFPFPMEIFDTLANMVQDVEIYVMRNPELKNQFAKVKKLYENRDLFVNALCHSHESLGIPHFLCHGDLWTYNIMFEKNANDTASNNIGAIIDWQNFHVGSPTEDLCHMLTFCSDTETRRRAEKEYLPLHYEKLKNWAEKNGKPLGFTLSQFLESYKRGFIAHALHVAFIMPTMLCLKVADTKHEQEEREKAFLKKNFDLWEDCAAIMESYKF